MSNWLDAEQARSPRARRHARRSAERGNVATAAKTHAARLPARSGRGGSDSLVPDLSRSRSSLP
jgi:hypothetical protein